MQEKIRKDVERAFGVLQSRFAFLKTPSRLWFQSDMLVLVKCCVILHNMIIRWEGNQFCANYAERAAKEAFDQPVRDPKKVERIGTLEIMPPLDEVIEGSILAAMLHKFESMRSSDDHATLKKSLIDNLWAQKGTKRSMA
eukprot:TRINITY_DN7158_c0_g1_i5.p1 TRINITY_DN7158_c0_g1~~TRINITY_DN7158_c0_g1_i5.p1  ORF type:complete len:140 (+),score=36.07 TRINITY_DN7158_c0_g1_i5:383-802(+)